MKTFKSFLMIIGVLALLGVIGIVVFMNMASDEDKRTILRETGLEDSGFARDVAKESYVICEVATSRRNLLGNKWVIKGFLYTSNETMNFSTEKIRFNFSDGSEIYSFSIRINGSQNFKRPFTVRIPGHSNANFIGVEVVEVN